MSKQKQFVYTTCTELVVFSYRNGNSMNNLFSYCGLVDTRIRASDKDLPVLCHTVQCGGIIRICAKDIEAASSNFIKKYRKFVKSKLDKDAQYNLTIFPPNC